MPIIVFQMAKLRMKIDYKDDDEDDDGNDDDGDDDDDDNGDDNDDDNVVVSPGQGRRVYCSHQRRTIRVT